MGLFLTGAVVLIWTCTMVFLAMAYILATPGTGQGSDGLRRIRLFLPILALALTAITGWIVFS
jgi:hypothetical protein